MKVSSEYSEGLYHNLKSEQGEKTSENIPKNDPKLKKLQNLRKWWFWEPLMHFMGPKIFLFESTESQLSNDGLKNLLRRLNVKKSQFQKNSQKCFFCRFLWAKCVWIPVVFGNCFICTHHSQNLFYCFHEVLLECCWKYVWVITFVGFWWSSIWSTFSLLSRIVVLRSQPFRLRSFMAVTNFFCNFSILFWFFPWSDLWVSFDILVVSKTFTLER